jgi:sporulation integral membrane protein YtvI
MDEKAERRKRFLINLLYWAAILAILYVILNYVIGELLPLLIGVVFARLLNPLIRLITRKTRIPRRPVAVVFVLLFIGVIGTPVTLGIIKLVEIIPQQISQVEGYYDNAILPALKTIESWVAQNLQMFFPEWDVGGEGTHLLDTLTNWVKGLIASMNMTAMAMQIPAILLRVLFTFLFMLFATVYFEEGKAFILRQMPVKNRIFLSETIVAFKKSVASYYGGYLKIMAVTFVELLIGLSIIRGSFSIVPAFFVAFVDFLPVLGCGMVLVPWAGISLIMGNTAMGIGLLILYVIVFVIRQFIEPKIVGDQLGLNPLLMLTSMYIGYLAMNVLGLIVMPIIVTVIVYLQKHEKIHVFK